MSPKPAQLPRVAATSTALDCSILPTSLPAGSLSVHLIVSCCERSSIGARVTTPVTVKVSLPGLSITTILLEPSARRMPEKSCLLPSEGAPVIGATITLTCGGGGAGGGPALGSRGTPTAAPGPAPDPAAAAWRAASAGVSGTVTPAATAPTEREPALGVRPIRVATRGAACCAMRDTNASLASA